MILQGARIQNISLSAVLYVCCEITPTFLGLKYFLHKRYFSDGGRNSRAFEQKDRLASKVSPPLQLERAGWHKVRLSVHKRHFFKPCEKMTHFMKIQGKWGKPQ